MFAVGDGGGRPRCCMALLEPGDVLVAPVRRLPGRPRRRRARTSCPRGVEVQLVPTDEAAIREALPRRDARLGRDAVEPRARRARHRGARRRRRTPRARCWPSTTRSPRRSRSARSSSAPTSRCRARTKALTGHSDLILGHVAARDAAPAERAARRGARGPARSRGRSRSGSRTARSRRSTCASSASARTRWRSPRRSQADDRVRGVRYPGLPSHPGHEVAARQMGGRFGMVARLRAADADAAQRFLARVRARRRGDELRRRAHDRRAPRALGHRRRVRGLHPAERGARGRGRPRRRRPACAGRRVILKDDLKIVLAAVFGARGAAHSVPRP